MLTSVWVQRGRPDLIPVVRWMFEEYQAELNLDLCFQGFQEELRMLPGKYGPPRGALLLVLDGSLPAACGGLCDLGDDVCELKRLFVRPDYRRHGLGRSVSETLIDRARALRYKKMRLDTLTRLAAAVTLYESLGFVRTQPYNYNPEPDIEYFERDL